MMVLQIKSLLGNNAAGDERPFRPSLSTRLLSFREVLLIKTLEIIVHSLQPSLLPSYQNQPAFLSSILPPDVPKHTMIHMISQKE